MSPGRPVGGLGAIPRSVKDVMVALAEGSLEVAFRDPITGAPTTGSLGHLVAEQIVLGLSDPDRSPFMVKICLEYGIGKPKVQALAGEETQKKQIPRMIFLHKPRDPLDKSGREKPLMILGQKAGANGAIVDAITGEPVAGTLASAHLAAARAAASDGLGEGEDRLEVVTDPTTEEEQDVP